jgi:hypothetical protein
MRVVMPRAQVAADLERIPHRAAGGLQDQAVDRRVARVDLVDDARRIAGGDGSLKPPVAIAEAQDQPVGQGAGIAGRGHGGAVAARSKDAALVTGAHWRIQTGGIGRKARQGELPALHIAQNQ